MERLNKITSFNLDGRLSNLIQFEETISKHLPLICLFQDIPKLNKENLENTCSTIAREYDLYYDESTLRRYKCLNNLILVHKERVVVNQVHIFNGNRKASTIGISINCIGNENDECDDNTIYSKLIIFSVYIRPRASHTDTKSCFDWIDQTAKQFEGHSRMIIAGDMNATESTWCPIQDILENRENSASHYRQIKQIRGRIIINAANKMKITCLNRINQGPTFRHSRGDAYIDLAFAGNKALRTWDSVTLEKLCDASPHRIVIIQAKGQLRIKFRKRTYTKIRVNLINEAHFIDLHNQCDNLCVNWKQLPRERIIKRLERVTNILYQTLIITQEKITTKVTRRIVASRRAWLTRRTGVINVRIRKYISRLRKHESKLKSMRARGLLRRLNNSDNEHANNQGTGFVNRQKIKAKISRLRKSIIDNLNTNNLHSMHDNLNEYELWDRIHNIDRTLNGGSNNIDLNNDRNSLETQNDIDNLANTKFPHKNRAMLTYVESAIKARPNSVGVRLTEDEIIIAVLELRKKMYTSSIGVRMDVFYNSLMFLTEVITAIAEMSFWTCYIPKRARFTQGTLIPKKAAGQFRIVHVSNPLAALLEIIALRRLEHKLEALKINSPYQFGFVALVSRHDLIARVLEFFYKSYIHEGKKAAGLIFSLDIEGAFDNVNQDILIQKLNLELGNDAIKYWLANFILNREISIKKGQLKSVPRDICMGVPQGSALGPILWNYIISNLDTNICIPCRAELVRYADDIILIYNGSDREEAQEVLDKLVFKLRTLDLNIRPEKCSVMGIRLGMHDNRRNFYSINGIPIQKVKWINLLGVPITNKLKLHRGSKEHKEKLLNSIKKLHSFNRLGFIKSAKEWNIMIDSYIKSRFILNNWPILLMDSGSCKWTDERMIKALRLIFGWPTNTSTKLIQLITSNLHCEFVVKRIAKQRALTQFGDIYDFLITLSAPGTLTQIMELDNTNRINRANSFPMINLETDICRERKHPDPIKTIRINQIERIENEIEMNGPTWIVLEKGCGSMLAEVTPGRNISQIRVGRHREYSINYFNTFATLLKASTDKRIIYRCITLSSTNSLLNAIENYHNRDWRIIQIRERMWDNGWRINKVNPSEEERLINSVINKYGLSEPSNSADNVTKDLYLWLKSNSNCNNEERASASRNMQLSHQIELIDEPDVSDYKRRNFLNKWAPIEDNNMFQQLHTTITRTLCNRAIIWQNINPSWINGSKMLVLSGLFSNSRGRLEHGSRESSDTCNLCENIEEDSARRYATTGPSGLSREAICSNTILHRAFMCKALINTHEEFLTRIRSELVVNRAARSGREYIEQILCDGKTTQKFLSYLVKCAFENNTQ